MKRKAQYHKYVISPKVSPTQTHQSPTGLFLVELKKLILEFCFVEEVGDRVLELNCAPLKTHMLQS